MPLSQDKSLGFGQELRLKKGETPLRAIQGGLLGTTMNRIILFLVADNRSQHAQKSCT